MYATYKIDAFDIDRKKDYVNEANNSKDENETFHSSFSSIMLPTRISLPSINPKPASQSIGGNHRWIKSSTNDAHLSEQLIAQLLKFRIDGRTINARNVDELYPGLDRLLMRSLQTGDCRQLYNRLKRNLKPEYLLITGKHIHISVCAQTQNVLEKLVEMGATLGKTNSSSITHLDVHCLDLHFYEPIHMKELELMCQYGFEINERLPKYHHQTPLSIFINKRYSISMLNVLIENGAQFDSKDDQGQTCLHHACLANVTDSVFDYLVEQIPKTCLNLTNQSGATPLDLLYLGTYEQPTTFQMRRLHVLLSRRHCKLTRYGMREPNLFARKQYKLPDIISCKEFLFKYRLRDLFDPSIRPLVWCIFLFYDVLRACEKHNNTFTSRLTTQQRLDRYLISMIENGEIPLDKLIFRSNTNLNEADQQMLTDTQNSLLHMTQIKIKLSELRCQTLTLKALCRMKIKETIRTFPNDIVKLKTISKLLQGYLTFYNPFVKGDANEKI